jgi:glycosyltransferase involved in cell wall biosynthesis
VGHASFVRLKVAARAFLSALSKRIAGPRSQVLSFLLRLRFFGARAGLREIPQTVFLVHPRNRGWILEAICREIAQRCPGPTVLHYSVSAVPPARNVFVSHYSMLPDFFTKNTWAARSRVFVWYTHPRAIGVSEAQLVRSLNMAYRVFCPNSWVAEYLHKRGVQPTKLAIVLGGADPHVFSGHARNGAGAIGFCSAFYERKRPDCVLDIARAFPEHQILLLGRGWQEWRRFAELRSLPNLHYVEPEYSAYPSYYNKMDVFVSPAVLEGGPIPLLEAMMSNVVPVASDTGFARDLIRHGENGYIFAVDADSSTIIDLVRLALANRLDIRATVKHLSWERFAREIIGHMAEPREGQVVS